ncbi:MAG: hypothetical protein J6Q84_00905, partial [Kiritimatiellae bacterium]|nr:hypothetical protein [Kiritimatiellia bacterium]
MVDAAIAAGTLTKAGDDLYEAGGKTFSMQQLFIDGLQHQWATTDVMMKVFGDYGDETTAIGKKAYSAAQDIKTFSMMMDSLKATAGTGWKDTWQIIFGDLDEAKVLWTGLNNFISGIITKFADVRNGILEGALGKSFTGLSDKINNIVQPAKDAAKVVENLGDIVDKVILGKFGNGQERFDALTKSGQNYYRVQNKVNETLGNSYRYTDEQIAAQDKLLGKTTETTEATGELNKTTKDQLKQLVKLSDAELKALGYSQPAIDAINELRTTAEKLGIPIEEFIDNLDKINGRWLLLEGLKNVGKSLVGVFKAIGKAWQEIFDPENDGLITADMLFNLIAAFHKFSRTLSLTDEKTGELNETGQKLQRVFKGIFAVVDILSTVLGGALKIAFKVLTAVLDYFGMDILDLAAIIGDALVKFRDWIDKTLDFSGAVSKVIPWVIKAGEATSKWFKSFKESEGFQKFVGILVKSKNTVVEWFKGLKDAGLLDKFASGLKTAAVAIREWFAAFKDSKIYSVGKYIIEGFINGIKNNAG